MSDRQHVRMWRWCLTLLEIASSCLEVRAAAQRPSSMILGNGTEKIGHSMKILVPQRDRVMHWPMTAKRERIVLFGGSAGNVNFNDTWEWDGDNWTQVADNGPSARGGHAMAYDSSRGRVILFGGDDGQNSFGDTWAWDGTDWTQEEDTGPAARTGHAMDYDRVRDRVVVADGAAKSIGPVQVTVWVSGWFGSGHYETHTEQQMKVQYLNDTWEYDGSVWTRVADTGPEARWGCGLVFNGKTMILFGGKNDTTFFKNTWEWDGKHWTQRQDIGPAARAFAALAYDSARERAVLFGGTGQSLFGDTWEQFFQPEAVKDG